MGRIRATGPIPGAVRHLAVMVVSWSLVVGLGLLVGAAVVSAATRYGRPIAIGSNEFLWPFGIAVDSAGDVFVSGAYFDVGGRTVQVVEVPVL